MSAEQPASLLAAPADCSRSRVLSAGAARASSRESGSERQPKCVNRVCSVRIGIVSLSTVPTDTNAFSGSRATLTKPRLGPLARAVQFPPVRTAVS